MSEGRTLPTPLTDYRVVPVDLLGARGGLTRVWAIHTGPYHREIGLYSTRREALEELAHLVNQAHAGETCWCETCARARRAV